MRCDACRRANACCPQLLGQNNQPAFVSAVHLKQGCFKKCCSEQAQTCIFSIPDSVQGACSRAVSVPVLHPESSQRFHLRSSERLPAWHSMQVTTMHALHRSSQKSCFVWFQLVLEQKSCRRSVAAPLRASLEAEATDRRRRRPLVAWSNRMIGLKP